MVGLGVPLSLIGSLGTEGEETAPPVLHRRFDTQRLLSKKTARMGDEGKAAGCVSPAALLSDLAHRSNDETSEQAHIFVMQLE
jgi:hypothetical protein